MYISRLLLPAWERRLVTSSGGTKPLHFRISAETMQVGGRKEVWSVGQIATYDKLPKRSFTVQCSF